MLNTRHKKSKNIFFSLILCFAMIISAFAGIHFSLKSEEVYAGSDYVVKNVSSDLLNSYHNFYTTSTAKPATPNGWSEITTNQVNKDNIIKGIVDVTDESTFKTSTYKTTRPNMPKDESSDDSYFKNLMINSFNGAGRFGYKSNSISLEANSYYEIRVKLYTHRTAKTDDFEETDPTASIYLTGLTDDKKFDNQVKFENINTLTSWTTYSFYIDTNSSASVNLELWLGSKTTSVQGAVFFNNVKIYRYSEDYYTKYILANEDTDTNNFNIISLSQAQNLTPVDNSSFETTTPMGWKNIAKSTTETDNQLCQIVDANNYSLVVNDNKTITAPGSNNSANNSHCLFMYNKENGYQAIESSKIKIQPLSYYKITFWAKSDCNTGSGATVYLVDKTENNPIENASLTLGINYTKNSNIYRNDWTQYSFYVYGSENEVKNVTIQIWLGTTSSKTSGYVFVDDFRMEEISYDMFSNNSSSTNSSSLNFNSDSDSFVIVNSNFNKTSNEDISTTYPLDPTSWSKSGDTNSNTFSGVINASEEPFNANIDKYTNTAIMPTRPTNHPIHKDNNNVLMIGSTSENNSQTYSSSNISLSSDSYYKLSYYVFTSYDRINDKNNGASVSLTTNTRTLYDYQNIYFTDNQWHQFVVYFKTGVNSESATLNLNFKDLTGYVYFDDIRLETSKEEIFNNFTVEPEVTYTKADLSYENFDNKTFNSNGNIQTPNGWTATEQGVENNEFTINETNRGIIKVSDNSSIDVPSTLSGNANALFIQSLHDTNFAYTTNDSYTFNAKTYYKISVNVLTKNISSESTNEDAKTYGARISLDGSNDIIFKGINTLGGWKTYTIYLTLENELTSKISLALGNKDEKVSGTVLFDNFKIETIDQDTMKNELLTADESTIAKFINYTENTEDTTEDNSTWSNEFNWLILPSLLTALALIIAVVGFYVRKINFTRKPKIKTKYDRRKTLDKDIDRRERIALRQQIIDELNAELLSIDEEIAEYNRLAEEQLEQLKAKIMAEKEEIKRQKIEIEIRKKEATSEREKQLKANPELVGNARAEKEFVRFMEKLDKQEMHLQKQLNLKDIKLDNTKEADKSKIAKFLERKEFIKNEIAKIEAEIESIAKEETEMWEEYKRAKIEAKQTKAENRKKAKLEKENKSAKSTNSSKTNKTKKSSQSENSDTKSEIDVEDNKSENIPDVSSSTDDSSN